MTTRDLRIGNRTPSGPYAVASTAPFLEQLREEVVQRLGVHFACGDLNERELQRRLALALQAPGPDALDLLVADLPLPAAAASGQSLTVADPPPERALFAAFMGANVRKGPWVVPRHLKVVAIMGGAEVDLREARFAAGVTEIEVLAIMGGIDIYVPPGVRVETLGVAVMGGVETDVGDVALLGADAPVLRISGLAVMGGVNVRAKRPSTKKLARFGAMLAKARSRAQRAG